MKLNDAVIGALLLALSVFIVVHVGSFPNIPGQNIGPAAFPRLIALLLALCALLLIVRGWNARGAMRWAAMAPWVRSPAHVLRFAAAIGVLLGYAAWSERLGFIVSGALVLVLMFLSLRVRIAAALPLAAAITLVIHSVFYKLLRVPLPWGWLEPIAW